MIKETLDVSKTSALAVLGDKLALTQIVVSAFFVVVTLLCLATWALARREVQIYKTSQEAAREQLSRDLNAKADAIGRSLDTHKVKSADIVREIKQVCEVRFAELTDARTRQALIEKDVSRLQQQSDSDKKLIEKDLENFEVKLSALKDTVDSVVSIVSESAKISRKTQETVGRVEERLEAYMRRG